MTKEDIIHMAREAGMHRQQHNLMSKPVQYRYSYDAYEENLERFAQLVAKHTMANIDPSSFMSYQEGYAAGAAAEREALASEAERNGNTILAMQIRARGQQ